MNSLLARIITRLAFLPFVIGLLVLWPAGTFDFWQIYAYFGFILIPMVAGGIYFYINDPAVLERRLKTNEKEDTQKLVMVFMGLAVVASYMIPGFDKRFGWSDIPVWLVLLADAVVVVGYLVMLYVMKVNSFAARTIEVEQNQRVIDTGPYALVRHPMYTGAVVMYLATPVALGSWWAFLAVAIVPFCLVARILNEEQVLNQELDGYTEYTQRTRWRLIPGIW
ncbi:MAG TPA: isoprenylcysteine carboxylmethyltransferase family protein [Gammaproteobacteria bacterium]|nr:isoprenylcysteine carboxylmethyltransferase family protein [Gammaproteobacteria bacterium]